MFPYNAIVLIGMSGVGKTTNAEKYGEKTTWDEALQKILEGRTFLYISADNNIAYRLKDKGELPEPDGDSVSLVDHLAAFVGKFEGDKTRKEFFERQKLYSDTEEIDLKALPHLLHGLYEKQPQFPHPLLYDTTGSFCEVLKKKSDPLYAEIREHACLVYLECSEQDEKILLQRQIERPKPMVYDKSYFDAWLEDYLKQQSQTKGEFVPDDFLRFIFPKTIEYRRARYEDLADVTLTAAELERLISPEIPPLTEFPERFLSLVESKLQRVPSTERTAKEQPQEQATSS